MEVLPWLIMLTLAGSAVYFQSAYQKADKRANAAESVAKSRQDTINDMRVRQRDVAALDAKYTGELADAKATIDQLERDVADGHKRLRINTKCSARNTTGTTGLDDATSPGLTESAQRDYFTLRQRIEVAGRQIAGLQQYIRQQCLK